MELISESGMKNMLNKYDVKVNNPSLMKQAFERIIKKCMSQAGGDGHAGLTVLPSEYYGTDSGRYFDSVSSTNMTMTDQLSRPALSMTGAGDAYIVSAYKMKSVIKNSKRAKHVAAEINSKAHVFMSKVAELVKNKERLVGSSHISSAFRKMDW